MTHEMKAILALFRIGNRFVPRTNLEIARTLGMDRESVYHLTRALKRDDYLDGDKIARGGEVYFFLTERGKSWLNMQPVKRGRVLTAVPKEAAG